MTIPFAPLLAAALALLPATPMQAAAPPPVAAQTLLAEHSSIRFVSRQMGVPVEGRFRRFTAHSRFDPRRPEASTVQIDIDLQSVDIGHADTEAELRRPGWLDAQRRPTATFRSSGVRALGQGRFEVQGTLEIKALQQAVAVPVQLSQQGGVTVARGQFAIRRLDFRIGDGEWNDLGVVANEVQVHFQLALQGVPPH